MSNSCKTYIKLSNNNIIFYSKFSSWYQGRSVISYSKYKLLFFLLTTLCCPFKNISFSIIFVVYQIFYLLSFFNDISTHDKEKSQDHVDNQMTS
jgi:hypothetical protein